MSYAYFMMSWKDLGSLESNRTKFESKLWFFGRITYSPLLQQGDTNSHFVRSCSSKEVMSVKGLTQRLLPGRHSSMKTPTHHWFIIIQLGWQDTHWNSNGQDVINWKLFGVYITFSLWYYQFSLCLEAISIRIYTFRMVISSSWIEAFKISFFDNS